MIRSAGMPAAGLADRANLFGALEYSSYAKDAGVQPIIGCAIARRVLSETAIGPGMKSL